MRVRKAFPEYASKTLPSERQIKSEREDFYQSLKDGSLDEFQKNKLS